MEFTKEIFIKTCKELSNYDAIIVKCDTYTTSGAIEYRWVNKLGSIRFKNDPIMTSGFGWTANKRTLYSICNTPSDKVLILTTQEFINKFINKRSAMRQTIRKIHATKNSL